MTKTLELAISKAAALPDAAQEQLGRELLERIEALEELRAELDIGLQELDAGLGKELDIEDVIKKARASYAGSLARRLVWAPASELDLIKIWHYYARVGSAEVANKVLRDIQLNGNAVDTAAFASRPRKR